MKENIKTIVSQIPTDISGKWISIDAAEQLAKTMVVKCADSVAQMVVRDKGRIPQDPESEGWNTAVEYAGKELKKMFGVENA